MTKRRFRVDTDTKLLQGFRLTHALMESEHRLLVPWQDRKKYRWLADAFGLEFGIETPVSRTLHDVSIDHARPWTQIGAIEQPLIFAHGIFDLCRSLWSAERAIEFHFSGYMSPTRYDRLNRWQQDCGGVVSQINSSDRGRSWPIKGWDLEYFQQMCNSNFVLCPDGDFIWTYRFFEATICGAIPVIQNHCDLYDGFQYYTMDQSLPSLRFDRDIIEHNATVARERLTVPADRLSEEIQKQLSR